MYPTYGGFGSYGNYNLYGALVAYGSLNLTESSPPQSFTEPLTLAEVKDYLHLPQRSPADSAEDATIAALISAARTEAEIMQGRDIVRKQWDLSLDYWPSYRIELRGPLASVDLVRYRDSDGNYTTMTENTDYVVDTARQPGAIVPPFPGPTNRAWPTFTPWPSSAILIRFTSGFAANSAWWADTGAVIKVGMKYLINLWFLQRLPFQVGSAASDALTAGLLSHGAVLRVK